MAQAQLGAVVRHLRKLMGSATARELSDAQLLQHFAGRHEEEAFAVLVERHGRLVWSACWQVLHHEQDAEDAFQATFLVLARQAGSIRNGVTLPSWLYRVAYRTATKLRVDKTRRHAHEREAATMPHNKAASELAWRELQAVLVEELERLPEKYRSPFLLCCMEGKSKSEAARELGWKEGTVSGRLALARKQMQQRLARRGVSLSAVLCALALRPESAAAALSGMLLDTTVRSAVLFAGAESAAELAPAPATSLAQGVLKAMAVSKVKSASLVLLALAVAVGGAGAFTRYALADKPAASEPPAPAAPQSAQLKSSREQMQMPGPNAKAAGKAGSLQEPDPKSQVLITGQVCGPDGKPVAGAQVAVVAGLKLADTGISLTLGGLLPEAEVLGLGKTDDAGRYRIPVPKKAHDRVFAAEILAGAPGYALAVQALQITPKPADTLVRLEPDEALQVRLIDLEGLPAAGVRVSVVRLGKLSYSARRQYTMNADAIEPGPIFYQDFNNLGNDKMMRDALAKYGHAIQFSEPPANLPFWPRQAVTDAQGRLTLRGLQRGQVLGVQIRDERYGAQNLEIEPPAPGAPNEAALAIGPSRLLEGTITDAVTGKPVPHARMHIDTFPDYFGGFGIANDAADEKGRRFDGNYLVSMGPQISRMDIQADERGHYRVRPFVGNTQVLTVTAPMGQPYLAIRKNLTWPKGSVRQEANLALAPGVVVQGRVAEANGKPVSCQLDFWSKEVKPPNPFTQKTDYMMYAKQARTRADGTFRVVLPPGKWYVLANSTREDYLWQKVGVEKMVEVDRKKPAEEEDKGGAALDAKTVAEVDTVPGVKEGDKHYFKPDGWAVVEAKLGQAAPEVSITLHRSKLEGRLLTPDGKPVARARMYYRRRSLDWRAPAAEVTNGRFSIPVPDLDTTYRVLFLDVENGLGAAADFSGKQAGGAPITITLAPCTSATVRFVDSQGKPVANYRPLVWAQLPPFPTIYPKDMMEISAKHLRTDGSVWLGHMDRQHYGNGPVTDADGRVTLPNLIPGAAYRISQYHDMAVNFTAEAGKATKVADVVLKDPTKVIEIPQ